MPKSALFTVFLVVLVDLMGFGIVLPLLPFFASRFQASPVAIGLLYSVYSLAQLVFSPFWGGLSDRVGRRPVMLASTFGSVCAYLLFSFSGSFAMLFASRLLAGVMGGNISTAQAYVADVTTHKERAKGMGLLGAAFGIGFVAGPALAALFVRGNQFAIPGLVAAGLSFLSFLLVLFKLPETIKPGISAPAPNSVARASIFSPHFWKSIFSKQGLPILMLSILLVSLGHSSLYSAFPLFCSQKLGFSATDVGLQFVWMGLVAVLIQGTLIHGLERRFGEKRLFLAGSLLMALGMALIPQTNSARTLWLALTVMAVGGSLNGPTLNSMISKTAGAAEVGKTMGTSQGLAALGRVVGPTWGGFLFSAGYAWPFLLTAFLVSTTFWLGLQFKEQHDL